MASIKNLAQQTAIYGLSTIVVRFLNYLLVPLYVIYFKPEQYGVVTEFYAYVTFLNILLTYGMETGFFKFSQDHDHKKVLSTTLFSLFVSTLFFFVVVLMFRKSIASSLGYEIHPEYIVWFTLILSFDTLSAIPFARLRILNRPIKFAAIKFLNVLLNIVFNVFFIVICPWVISHNPNSILTNVYNESIGIGYIFISNLIASASTFLIFLPNILKSFTLPDFSLLKKMLLYSIPLLIAGMAGNVNDSVDRVLLKYFSADGVNEMHELGIYGANIKIAVIMILFIQMYRFAAEPFFFNNSKEKNSKDTIARVTKYFTIFSLSIFLLITLNLNLFKYFIPNEAYWEGLKVVPIVLFTNLILGVYFNVSMWYKLTSKTQYGSYIAIASACLTLLLNVLFIGMFSYMACVWARLLGYLFMLFLAFYFGQKFYKINYDLKNIALYTSIALGIYFLSSLKISENIIINFLKNNIMLLAFVIFVIIKEKLNLLQYVRNKNSK